MVNPQVLNYDMFFSGSLVSPSSLTCPFGVVGSNPAPVVSLLFLFEMSYEMSQV